MPICAAWGGIFLLALQGCSGGEPNTTPVDTSDMPEGCVRADAFEQSAMRADLTWLASPELDGRAPGTGGDIAARTFIADRFACLGLTSTIQSFTDSEGDDTANILAIIPGTDLAAEVVVVTAHIDHFGDGLLGANDNASGVAGLLAVAHAMHDSGPPRRTVILAAVGSEEYGFNGSRYLMQHPPTGIDADRIVFNVNLDMIGSYRQTGVVYALGATSGTYGKTALKGLEAAYTGLDIVYGWGSDQSDNVTFCSVGIPYLFFWTEDNACYHDTCDTADRIDYPHLSQIARLVYDVVLDVANTSTDLAGAVRPGVDVCQAD